MPIATGVLRTELLQLQQLRDELLYTFAARVRDKSETCSFNRSGKVMNYTDCIIRDTRETLGIAIITEKPSNNAVALDESKEVTRPAVSI